MSHPEGSITEGYIFHECLTFCSRYLEGCETKFKRKGQNPVIEPECSAKPFFNNKGRFLAGKLVVTLDHKAWLQAHRYVLFNYDHISPYLRYALRFIFTSLAASMHVFLNNKYPLFTSTEGIKSICPQVVIEMPYKSPNFIMTLSMSGLSCMWHNLLIMVKKFLKRSKL